MRSPTERFAGMFEHWAKTRGTNEADMPLLKAMAFEFFAFGYDMSVQDAHRQYNEFIEDNLKRLQDEETKINFNVTG